ncbi:MAG: hypothetical protein PHD36_07375 [Desulfotomaculaceae bacterium]|nr:hypothetical protein [Desulfotomaculaceae bacterium]
MKIGAVALPFNILYKTGEIAYILSNSRTRVVFGASQEVKQNLLKILSEVPTGKR